MCEAGVGEIGISEVGAGEVDAREVEAREVGAREVLLGEVGLGEGGGVEGEEDGPRAFVVDDEWQEGLLCDKGTRQGECRVGGLPRRDGALLRQSSACYASGVRSVAEGGHYRRDCSRRAWLLRAWCGAEKRRAGEIALGRTREGLKVSAGRGAESCWCRERIKPERY